tara:strand:+ start:3512 stop:4024 length:513 start_codon:yes stop_codon:yes gene_type:complete
MHKKKAFFFDRDNTIIQDNGYTFKKKNLKFLPGVIKAFKYLKKKNFYIMVITNQSGIARGYFNKRQVDEFHRYMNKVLGKKGSNIDDFFVCGCHPDIPKKNNNCKCRKPSEFMLLKALKKKSLNKENVIMIGDKLTDKIASNRAKIKFYYKSKKKDLYNQVKKILKSNGI